MQSQSSRSNGRPRVNDGRVDGRALESSVLDQLGVTTTSQQQQESVGFNFSFFLFSTRVFDCPYIPPSPLWLISSNMRPYCTPEVAFPPEEATESVTAATPRAARAAAARKDRGAMAQTIVSGSGEVWWVAGGGWRCVDEGRGKGKRPFRNRKRMLCASALLLSSPSFGNTCPLPFPYASVLPLSYSRFHATWPLTTKKKGIVVQSNGHFLHESIVQTSPPPLFPLKGVEEALQ